jgi:glycerol-3-phosphate dehydrogenase
MNRAHQIKMIETQKHPWDVVVIGGGASGLGAAIDSASRGHKTLLLEKYDFAKGTSSKSTKLIHGGVRYLQKGNLKLVLESLRERGILLQNAPHLVRKIRFIIPIYKWWDMLIYGAGLVLYDLLAGAKRIQTTSFWGSKRVRKHQPTIKSKKLKGGIAYWDAQFDDARLAISIARTAHKYGATVVNYMSVKRLQKENSRISGVIAEDLINNKSHHISAKVVVNATGVFSDSIQQLDGSSTGLKIVPSQGSHLIVDKKFMPSDQALMVPKTKDGRVLFVIPWHNRLLIGTTDTLVDTIQIEPSPLENEVDFILETVRDFLEKSPTKKDVLSAFSGLRPLVAKEKSKTKDIPRDHSIIVSSSGLISIMGGKWTTYRKMSEQLIDRAQLVGGISKRKCITSKIKLDGHTKHTKSDDPMRMYGSHGEKIKKMNSPQDNLSLGENIYITKNIVLWAVRHEMAIHLEDVLARRTNCLLTSAKASVLVAPAVAKIMADELGHDKNWIDSQLTRFYNLAKNYQLNSYI